VSEPDDEYEKEAERVADAVMRMPDPTATVDMQEESSPEQIQRLCSRCQRRYRQGKPLNCEECEEELQRKAEESGAASDGSVERAAAVADRPGRPLSASTRSFFENRMGRDFSDVRVHTGPDAERAARSVNAEAFTLRRDVVFRSGAYRPGLREGRRLLAHELTHVVQQRPYGDKRTKRKASRLRIQRQQQHQEQDQPTVERGKRVEVKVVTFNQGGFDPHTLEPFRFWPRGHTAVIIDGDVYSFEADWECGQSEEEYKRDNQWRGAWVQVLDIPESDAKQLQQDFRSSCGRGAFIITGLCSSNAAGVLQSVLGSLEAGHFDPSPMELRSQLASHGYVERTYQWNRKVRVENLVACVKRQEGPQYRPAGLPKKEDIKNARDKCLKQLGLTRNDVTLSAEFLRQKIIE
jgi:hypothetical protein